MGETEDSVHLGYTEYALGRAHTAQRVLVFVFVFVLVVGRVGSESNSFRQTHLAMCTDTSSVRTMAGPHLKGKNKTNKNQALQPVTRCLESQGRDKEPIEDDFLWPIGAVLLLAGEA